MSCWCGADHRPVTYSAGDAGLTLALMLKMYAEPYVPPWYGVTEWSPWCTTAS